MLLRSRSFVAARLPRCSFVRCCAAVVQSPPVSPHASQRHTAHVHAPISPRGEERRIKAVALCTRICPQISPKCIHPRSLSSSSSSSPSSSTEVSACNDYRCSAASLHPSIHPSIHPSGVCFHVSVESASNAAPNFVSS